MARVSDPALKPLVISGHMDVVEAKPADWTRDPFTPVVENGYLYGRGATDMKLDGTVAIAALVELRREGYRPRRTIVIEFSGDEETVMKTSGLIAERLKDADLVLNIDGGGGTLDEKTGKPRYWTWQGAEKTYADFELTVTNPGGHSSAPRQRQRHRPAVAGAGADRRVPLQAGDERRHPCLFRRGGEVRDAGDRRGDARVCRQSGRRGGDRDAERRLRDGRRDRHDVRRDDGQRRPCDQRAAAARDGEHQLPHLPRPPARRHHGRTEARRGRAGGGLHRRHRGRGAERCVAAAGGLRRGGDEGAWRAIYPGVPVFPSQSSGASDSMWFRYHHVPSYGASPMFIKGSDDFSHGLNEREPIANIAPAITYYLSVFRDLSQ